MANPVKPETLDALLGTSNWSMASTARDRVFNRRQLFAPPEPPPAPALIVPVDVQALYVPSAHTERYIKLPLELGGLAGQSASTPAFSEPETRPQGIHLHWALPDGLLRGEFEDDPDSPIRMRALPDRWLVVRYVGHRNSAKLNTRAWVIESETGQVFDLSDYPDPSEATDGDNLAGTGEAEPIPSVELNGIVGGSPTWTAGYDATRNRFAFYDPLTAIDPGSFTTRLASYVITGWWSQRTHDPLARSYSSLAVSRRIAEFGWSASDAPVSPVHAAP